MHKGANDVQGARMKLVIAIGGNALPRRGQGWPTCGFRRVVASPVFAATA